MPIETFRRIAQDFLHKQDGESQLQKYLKNGGSIDIKGPISIENANSSWTRVFDESKEQEAFDEIFAPDSPVISLSEFIVAAQNSIGMNWIARPLDTKLLLSLLNAGMDPNTKDPITGDTLLHLTSRTRNVELLLARGGDPEIRNLAGESAMEVQVQSGFKNQSWHKVKLMADFLKDKYNDLISSIENGGVEELETYLANKGNPDLALSFEMEQDKPLYASLLHIAVFFDNVEAADMLLKAGADPKSVIYTYDVDKERHTGDKPLHLAVGESMIKTLQPYYADIFSCVVLRNAHGDLPIHNVGTLDQLIALTSVLEIESDINALYVRGYGGSMPLHNASTPDIAEYLLHLGADINAKDSMGKTPEEVAIIDGRDDVAAFLAKCRKLPSMYDMKQTIESDDPQEFRHFLNMWEGPNWKSKIPLMRRLLRFAVSMDRTRILNTLLDYNKELYIFCITEYKENILPMVKSIGTAVELMNLGAEFLNSEKQETSIIEKIRQKNPELAEDIISYSRILREKKLEKYNSISAQTGFSDFNL